VHCTWSTMSRGSNGWGYKSKKLTNHKQI